MGGGGGLNPKRLLWRLLAFVFKIQVLIRRISFLVLLYSILNIQPTYLRPIVMASVHPIVESAANGSFRESSWNSDCRKGIVSVYQLIPSM